MWSNEHTLIPAAVFLIYDNSSNITLLFSAVKDYAIHIKGYHKNAMTDTSWFLQQCLITEQQ